MLGILAGSRLGDNWKTDVPLRNKSLKDMVMGLFEAQTMISFERGIVVLLHVKSDAGDVSLAFCPGQHMVKKRLKNAAPPKIRPHINTLQPPKIAVAPIAPFVGNKQLANHRTGRLG
jgi:hypothetical protein